MSFELQVVLKTSLILLVGGLLSLLLRRSSAAVRHAIWALSLTTVLAFPVVSGFLPPVQLAILPENARFVTDAEPLVPAIQQSPTSIVQVPVAMNEMLPISSAATNNPWSWRQRLLFAWALGAVVVFGTWLRAGIELRKLRRASTEATSKEWSELLEEVQSALAVKRRVQLRFASESLAPMTWGIVRHVILLPPAAMEWSRPRRRLVLQHEMAHVKRRDGLGQILSQIACSIYWFNPLVWYAVFRLRVECERACDDTVLRLGTPAADYAGHLVDIARGLNSRFVRGAVSMAHPSQLKSRVVAILDDGIGRCRLSFRFATVLLALTGAVTLSVAVVRVTAMAVIPTPMFSAPAIAPSPLIEQGAPEPALVPAGSTGKGDASIDGRVVNLRSGDPVRGARVILNTDPVSDTPLVAMADDAGHFEFKKVSAGTYQLLATRDGYVRGIYGQRSPNGPGTSLTVHTGQSLSALLISMTPTGSISGAIRNRFGEPVANVTVRALKVAYQAGLKTLMSVQAARTNDLGEYRLYYLEPGQYAVSALPAEGPVPLAGANMQVGRLNVLPGSAFTGAAPTSVITAMATYTSMGILSPSDTGETYVPLYFPGVADLSAAGQIDLRPASTVSSIDFVISEVRAVRIRGQVQDAAGQPAKGTSVILVPQGGAPASSDRYGGAKDDGTLEFRGIPPGSYNLIALSGSLPQGVPTTVPAGVGGALIDRVAAVGALSASDTRLLGRVPLRVGNLDLENVALTLRPGFRINGKISVEGLSPTDSQSMLNGLSVQLIPGSPLNEDNDSNAVRISRSRAFSMPGIVAGDGEFTITGAFPGEYRIAIRGAKMLPAGAYVQSARLENVDLLGPRLSLESEPRGELEIVIGTSPGTIQAAVVDEKRAPARAVTVLLIPDTARRGHYDLYFKVITDSEGKAKLENIPPGNYEVFAMEVFDEGSWWDPGFLNRVEGQVKSVRIEAGKAANLDLLTIR